MLRWQKWKSKTMPGSETFCILWSIQSVSDPGIYLDIQSPCSVPGRDDWRDDIKSCLRQAGGLGKPTVFLLTDSQIKEESFLEDVDSLLNSGEVPNLFPPDEKQEVMEVSG